MRHRARFTITYDALKQVLGLPEDAEIVGVQTDVQALLRNQTEIYVDHPDLPEVYEGEQIPFVTPFFEPDPKRQAPKFINWSIR